MKTRLILFNINSVYTCNTNVFQTMFLAFNPNSEFLLINVNQEGGELHRNEMHYIAITLTKPGIKLQLKLHSFIKV